MLIEQFIDGIMYLLKDGIYAFLGGGVFLLSWIWQVYISQKTGRSRVDLIFWVLRFTGMTLLTIHVSLRRDFALVLMNIVGLGIALYNIYLFWKKSEGKYTEIVVKLYGNKKRYDEFNIGSMLRK